MCGCSDHVNPEASWPEVAKLRAHTEAAGFTLVPRLPAYPKYVSHRSLPTRTLARWQHEAVAPHARRLSDAEGLARSELGSHASWHSGLLRPPPAGDDEEDHRWLPFGDGFEAMLRAVGPAGEGHDEKEEGRSVRFGNVGHHPRVSDRVARALEDALDGNGLSASDIGNTAGTAHTQGRLALRARALNDTAHSRPVCDRGDDGKPRARARGDLRRGRSDAPTESRSGRLLRRVPQHQLHEPMHVQLHLLRLLQGQDAGQGRGV